jgi:hypothetical protein
MALLRDMASSGAGQVLLTSHSASIMARVEPEEVRYLRLDSADHTTQVRSIRVPAEATEAHKFVREAVKAYPELYFARLVVLGEGDSEEIVLPRIAECHGVPIDSSFVSIVPLGGRHVNHFWRLLDSLDIPYLTLLDLDRERQGGGWARIKYALKQLLELGADRAQLLVIEGVGDGRDTLTDDELEEMHTWEEDPGIQAGWIARLEGCGVFFSQPLDLDFTMLRALPERYQGTALEDGGPAIPDDGSPDYAEELARAVRAVLKKGTNGKTYSADERREFFWYRYLFLGRGKPTTHILALTELTDDELRRRCPAVLSRLAHLMAEMLEPTTEVSDHAP